MICLTRLNGHPIVINAELIETVEATPDTVISLTTGKKFVVLENSDEAVAKVIAYRRRVGLHVAETAEVADRPATHSLAANHED